MPARSSRRLWICLAVLAALHAFLLRRALFFGEALSAADAILRLPPWGGLFHRPPTNPLLSDQYLVFGPLGVWFYRQLCAGRLALWNPLLACGVPSAASMQEAFFFPLRLAGLDPFVAGGLSAFLKLWLAGTLTLLYLRRLGVGWAGAFLSAVSFSLSGFMIVWLGHPHVNAACLLPGMFLFIEDAARRAAAGRPQAPAWSAFALACAGIVLGGHPPTTLHVGLCVAAYAAARCPAGPARRRFAAGFAAAGGLGLLLAAPQLLPFLEYYARSSAPAASAALARAGHRLSWATLAHMLLPHMSGNYSAGFEELRALLDLRPEDNFNERTAYVGVLTLILALAAAVKRRDVVARFFVAAAAVSWASAYGLLGPVWSALPFLRQASPVRLLLIGGFSLSVLAGMGLDVGLRSARRGALWAGGLGAALFLGWIWSVFRPALPEMTPAETSFVLRQIPIFLGGLAAAAVLAWPRRLLSSRAERLLAVGWTAAEMLWFAGGYNPTVPRGLYYPSTPALERLARAPGSGRVLGVGGALMPDTAAAYGLADARGVDFMSLRRYEELVSGSAGDFSFFSRADAPPAVPALFGVDRLIARTGWSAGAPWRKEYEGEASVYGLEAAPGRALLVGAYETLPAAEALARARAPGFDPRSRALLEEEPGSAPSGAGAARIVRDEAGRVSVEARASAPALLVLFDNAYPGWKAFVDGRESRILRADYAFRAVAVPAGASRVDFVYVPAAFLAGLALAALAAAGLLAWLSAA